MIFKIFIISFFYLTNVELIWLMNVVYFLPNPSSALLIVSVIDFSHLFPLGWIYLNKIQSFYAFFSPSHVHQTGFEEDWNIQRISNEEKSKIKGFQTNFPKQGGCFAKWRAGQQHWRWAFTKDFSNGKLHFREFHVISSCWSSVTFRKEY